jgi:translocator protein
MTRNNIQYVLLLIGCIFIPLIIGFIGSLITIPNISGWYITLNKPWFTPPNWVFGPAWTIFYILMGISLWFVIRNGITNSSVRNGAITFAAQLIVNLLWSFIFFGQKSPVGGLITIVILLVLIIATIRSFKSVSIKAAYLLIPYLCWTCFATILTLAVVVLNN